MRISFSVLAACTIWLLTGCESTRRPALYLSHFGLKEPKVEDFEVCATAGCREIANLGYTPAEWTGIRSIFEPAPSSAADERERIKIAVGAMEQINGVKTNTTGDAPRNRRHLGTGPQLDCISEAANTTIALMLFEREGLLRFHRVGYPQHRGFLRLRLPHNTASIYENSTGDHYAVDSWFFKNGEPPICVPVDEWKAGYDPED